MIRFSKPTIKRRDMDSVLQTMVDEQIGPGDRCSAFTQSFAECVRCSSATSFRTYPDCIRTAFKIMGVVKDTKVAVSPLAPHLYLEILNELESNIVWVDVDRDNGLPDEISVQKAECEVLVLYENCSSLPLKYNKETAEVEKCDYGPVKILEDVSQSLGASYKDYVKAGDFGKVVVCAFEEDSIVSAGGGACLAVRNEMVYALRGNRPSAYQKLCDLNAALGNVQLTNQEENSNKRREIAKLYVQSLSKTRHKQFGLNLIDFENPSGNFAVFLDSKPTEVIKFAEKHEVPVLMTFADSSIKDFEGDSFESYPVSSAFFYRTVSFPLYPFLKSSEIDSINKVIAHLP